jgi:steroid delta-isomerase-like uncharacterized protein
MKQHPSSHPRRPLFILRQIVVVTILLTALLIPATQGVAASPPGFETGGIDSSPSNEMIAYRLFHEVFTGKNIDACPELVAGGAFIHTPDGLRLGHQGMSGFANAFRASFPNANFEVTEYVADGDMVVARWTMTGTHDGEFEGVAASGKSVTLDGISMLGFENGMIVEAQISYDRLHLLQQVDGDVQIAPTRICPPCATPD